MSHTGGSGHRTGEPNNVAASALSHSSRSQPPPTRYLTFVVVACVFFFPGTFHHSATHAATCTVGRRGCQERTAP
eukprot:m.42578 g.42578  ORF g.42578 m.42578 type:complete len:75 (+) comp6293_c0_seq1:98-322(+)